jgi:hypothetical protein
VYHRHWTSRTDKGQLGISGHAGRGGEGHRLYDDACNREDGDCLDEAA